MRNICCLVFFLFGAAGFAQEGLRPLRGNGRGFDAVSGESPETVLAGARQSTASLQLPFKEDFSYAPLSRKPRASLWADTGTKANSVYINSGYPIAPPSIGVATFDGLGPDGYPHEPKELSLVISRKADELVSRPINLMVAGTKTLQPSDSIGLSFYYQARGYGDNPEVADSLVVDFYDPTNDVWVYRVWAQKGNANANTLDTSFKRAFIRISDPKFLKENFRFRLRNRATPNGDFDHWHVDYIHLDQLQYAAEPVFDDLTFGYVPSSMLHEYSAMPFNQYRGNEMNDHQRVWIKNNSNQEISMSYKHNLYDASGTLLNTYNGGPENLGTFADTGYSIKDAHTDLDLGQTYSLSLMTDSADFRMEHILFRTGLQGNDYNRSNDTVWQIQRFRNYYAFDDGSAESGYFVNAPQAKMAVRIRLNERDTLRALRIYFDPVGEIMKAEQTRFRIHVWGSAGSGPSAAPLHSLSTEYTQRYEKGGFREFPEYTLASPIVLDPGTYFIGIQQQATTVTVGYDRNYDARKSLFYDSGSGWKQSQIRGAIMIRPVFGRKILPPVGFEERSHIEFFSSYPNPASDIVRISHAAGSDFYLRLIDATGKLLHAEEASGDTQLNVSALAQGIYFIMVSDEQHAVQTRKLIISR